MDREMNEKEKETEETKRQKNSSKSLHFSSYNFQVVAVIIIIIIIIQFVCLLSQSFLPGTSLEPAVIPTTQASSFTLQYFPYYV